MEKKIQKRFVDEGFGFRVILRNVPMVKVRGIWTPNINYNKLAQTVCEALAHKPARLTGNEIRFLRQQSEMTLKAFGERFDVSHVAVLNWERVGDDFPAMKWPIEKDIRLFALDKTGARPKAFKALYEDLRHAADENAKPIEMDFAEAA